MHYNDNLTNIYLDLINETELYGGYQINIDAFIPFEYHNVYCCAAKTNIDLKHVLTQLKKRTNNSLEDVFIVLKRGIDKYLNLRQTIYKNRIHKSFNIISKEFSQFKLAVQFTINREKNIVTYIEDESKFFYKCDFICFVYTVLEPDMIKRESDDNLYVENKQHFKNIYVD